jgi:C4-dicarboxylate transporter, DctM subunit
MNEITVGLLGIGVLLFFCLSGMELGVAMIVSGFLGFSYLRGFDAALSLMGKDCYESFAAYSFTVIPLFILMGQIAFNSGLATKLFDSARKFIGHIPGGLAVATVGGATLFKAICGSTVATTATLGTVAIPEMDRSGYKRVLSTGVIASVGILGTLIPPSAGLMVIAIILEQSVGRLFLSGIVPGLILAVFFVGSIFLWGKLDPTIAPKGPRFSWRDRMSSVSIVIWPLLIFVIVIGGLTMGLFTPTESASIGACAVILLFLFRRELSMSAFIKSVRESLRITAMVFLLLVGSNIFGHFLAMAKITGGIANYVAGLALPAFVIICIMILIYLLGGSIIDDMAFLVLATPVLYPAVLKLGYDPIWFAIVISITIGIGCLIPPMAINVFVTKTMTGEPIGTVYKGTIPFVASMVVLLLLVFIFPGIVSFLPGLLMK